MDDVAPDAILSTMARKAIPKTHTANMIREWREHRGLTQERLAARIGISAPSLSRIERGDQPYSQPILEALADALGCEPAALIMRAPPNSQQYELWTVIQGMNEEDRARAAAVLKALTPAA